MDNVLSPSLSYSTGFSGKYTHNLSAYTKWAILHELVRFRLSCLEVDQPVSCHPTHQSAFAFQDTTRKASWRRMTYGT